MSPSNTPAKILFVDDEEHLRIASKQALELAGFEVQVFASAEQVAARITPDFNGIVITDIRMPGLDGLGLMAQILERDAEFPVVLITGHSDVALAVKAMRAGAYDFIEKPFASAHLADVAARALDKRRLTLEVRRLRQHAVGGDDLESRLVGRSQGMVDLRRQIRAVGATDADVVIIGDTGTGKEVTARALHAISPRRDRPFVAINCGALPADLIESELFGHEAGAFAGALRTRFGKFEHAQRGTVFLDEIESMPEALQVKLLHAVQDRKITRLGSNDPIDLDVRFIAASKVDLETAAEQGQFRRDLLYRLNVATLRMPPLSQRAEDIPRLFIHLVQEAAARIKREVPDITANTLGVLAHQSWPGNVRQLRNAADRFVLGLGLQEPRFQSVNMAQNLSEKVSDFERACIAAALQAQGGSLKKTYETLGLSRKSLYEKMQKYALEREDFAGEDAVKNPN